MVMDNLRLLRFALEGALKEREAIEADIHSIQRQLDVPIKVREPRPAKRSPRRQYQSGKRQTWASTLAGRRRMSQIMKQWHAKRKSGLQMGRRKAA